MRTSSLVLRGHGRAHVAAMELFGARRNGEVETGKTTRARGLRCGVFWCASWRAEGSWGGLGGSGHLAGVGMAATELLATPGVDDNGDRWAGPGKG